MEDIKEKLIIDMYVIEKLSMMQIGQALSISPTTVQTVLDKHKIPRRTISEAITYLNITKFGKKPFRLKENLSPWERDLKITGIMLYWGEGSKTTNEVGFANSNPDMVRLFLLFLRRICGIDENRIKVMIHMYPDQDKDFLEKFWSDITGIKKEYFYRSYVHEGKKGTYKNKSQYGTVGIKYGDKKLLQLILQWIVEYKDIFLKSTPP